MSAFGKLWARLTEPHPSVTQPEERHRAHLLSVVLIVMGPLMLISYIVVVLTDYFFEGVFDPILVTMESAVIVGILLDYCLSRTRHTSLSAWILVGALFAGIFGAIIQNPQYMSSAVFLPLPLLLANLFLSPRDSYAIFFATLAGTLLLPAFGVGWGFGDLVSIIAMEIVFGVIIRLSSDLRKRYLRQIERQAQELEREKREAKTRAAYTGQRAGEITEALIALARLDFDKRAEVHGTGDVFDALAVGVNMLGEELQARIAQYRESEAKFRALAENIPAVTYIAALDAVGSSLYTSPQIEPMLGITVDEWMADPELWAKSLHPEDRERVLAEYDRATAVAELFRAEYRLVRRDGAVVWVRDESILIKDEHGHPRYQQGVIHDITNRVQMVDDLRRARDAAEVASRAKSEFLSVLSHELHTPLNAILGFAQLLEMDADVLPPRSLKSAQQIRRSGLQMLEMIDELLDYTRAEGNRLRLDIQTVDAGAAIETVCTALTPAAEQKSIRLTMGPHPAACPLRADPQLLDRILRILIGNAIKFTPAGGDVAVECEQRLTDAERVKAQDDIPSSSHGAQPSSVRFTVRDTGIGIAPAFLPHLFQPFTQSDMSGTRPHGGLGLGLVLARRLVEAHSGRIWAESAGEDKGSAVCFELPVDQPPAASQNGDPAETPEH